MPQRAALVSGALLALAAGLMWGLVFVAPLSLPQYPPALLSVGRYLAFGVIALPLALWDHQRIRQLTRADWIEASKLALIGNLVYYLFLSAAIQVAGAPLPTMIIGTLPVVIAICSNVRDKHREGRLRWRQLLPSLVLITLGIACVHQAELSWASQSMPNNAELSPGSRYGLGALLALGAVVCWTWYPLRNADWLRLHADRSPSTWATAQGLATLPLAVLGYAALWAWQMLVPGSDVAPALALPWGPTPERFMALMLGLGFFASWLGTWCWNGASQRLPTTLVGQLIIFETLAALAYAFVLRQQWPGALTAMGACLLVAGVVWALRLRPGAVN